MKLIRNPSHKHSSKILDEFNRLKASIYYKDHSAYSINKISNMIEIVKTLKNFRIKSEQIRWITKFVYDLDLDIDAVKEDYLPVVIAHAKYRDKLKPLFEYESQHDLFLEIQSLSDREIFVKEKDYGIIYSNDEFFIAVPETVEASQMLGKGTSWCTAAMDNNKYEAYILGNSNAKLILYYVIFMNRKPSDPNFKICISCMENNITPGFGLTVNSKNENKLLSPPTLDTAIGEYSEFIYKVIKEHSKNTEAHPMKIKAVKIIGDDILFQEEVTKRGLYPFKKFVHFPEKGYEERTEQVKKLTKFLMMFLISGKASSNNIEYIANITKEHDLFSRDEVLEIIEHQSEVLNAENFLKIYRINYLDNSILYRLSNHFKENELNKIAIHIYTSLRDIDIESFFRAAWYHKREACKIIYEMAYKDNNDILILKFDNIMRKMKQVS